MKNKILITGSEGFIVSHLIKELGCFIGLDIKTGNNILTCGLPDADIIIHMAAQTDVIASIADPIEDAKTNILGTIRLAKRYKNKRFIFTSSGGAIQEKIESPYGLSKFCAEEYIKMICNNYVILRFPNVYGERSRSVVDKFINNKECDIYGDGTATRDYVHVLDIVKAIESSMDWKKGLYSLGSEKSTTVLELAEATGKKINFLPKVKGEVDHSIVPNTAEWKAEVDVINYIRKLI